MSDKVEKFLAKLSKEQIELYMSLVRRLSVRDYYGLDVKPLKGHKDVYRLRRGKLRIIFYHADEMFLVIGMSNRNDQTYRDF